MAVNREDVRRVAALARLEVSHEEVDRLARELEGILGHIEALHRGSGIGGRESGTGAGEPDDPGAPDSAGAPGAPGAPGLRVDEPGSDPLSTGPERFAPAFQDGFFTVPRLASQDVGGG